MPRSLSFNQALAYVLKNEGGFVDNLHDSGGATNFGITLSTLSAWRKHPCSVQDVKDLGVGEAGDIYCALYWEPLALDLVLNPGVATAIFDQAVNRGVKTSACLAQSILHLPVDGVIGDKSVEALNAANPQAFIRAFALATLRSYIGIVKHHPSQMEFIDGWVTRAWDLLSLV